MERVVEEGPFVDGDGNYWYTKPGVRDRLPNSRIARVAIYTAIFLVVAAMLFFFVFPEMQDLLPEQF